MRASAVYWIFDCSCSNQKQSFSKEKNKVKIDEIRLPIKCYSTSSTNNVCWLLAEFTETFCSFRESKGNHGRHCCCYLFPNSKRIRWRIIKIPNHYVIFLRWTLYTIKPRRAGLLLVNYSYRKIFWSPDFYVRHFSMTEYLSPGRAQSVRVCVSLSVCKGL